MGDLRAGGGQRSGHGHVDPAWEGGDGLLGVAGEDGGLLGIRQQVLGPDGRVAEALGPGVGLDACVFGQLLGLRHQGDGLQHIKTADGTAGKVDLRAALPGRLLHLCIELRVRKGTDGDEHKVDAPAQHRHGHSADGLHGSSLHKILRLQGQQRVEVLAGLAAHVCGGLLGRSEGAAGDAHQLVVLQQAVLPRIRDDVAEEAAAYDAKFCFHGEILLFLFLH